jgi:ABC-2 type transport system permease protein
MNKLWILIVREYAQVVKKKSFLIGIFLTPLFMLVVTVIPSMLAMKKSATAEKISIIDIDSQGIGEKFSESIKRYKLEDSTPAYSIQNIYDIASEDTVGLGQLRGTLDSLILNKQLKSYLVFFKNVEQTDSVVMVAKSFGLSTINRFEKRISDILAGMRLQQSNIELSTDSVLTMTRRIDLRQQAPGGKERDFMTIYLGGIIFVMIIFMTIIGYGQILMRSVIEEKSSRIIEVMISSVSPFQLMTGKIIGLGLASLTQVGIWLAIGLGVYAYRGNLNISADISGIIFNPIFIGYFIIYLVIGYILYSTLFALIGSICNTDKEAQNYIMPITMSLILPMIIGIYIIQEPDSTLVTVLSLIPFFTPTLMILRLNVMGAESFAFTNPIILEATLGVIITAATTLLVIWLTSRIFRIGILMYGKRPTLPEIYKWIKY